MRLICPNCDAEYEVELALLPEAGRDVQCSNCNTVWFQKPALEEALPEPKKIATAAPTGGDGQRPATDPDALNILHEEVARESQARQNDNRSGLETQGELGLDTAMPDAPVATDAVADEQLEAGDEIMGAADVSPREEAPKRGRLPDIEEINSTLADAPEPDPEDYELEVAAPARRSRFRTGFGLMLMATALLVMVYARAPELATRFPQTKPLLASYVVFVDRMRVSLDMGAEVLLTKVNALTERVGS